MEKNPLVINKNILEKTQGLDTINFSESDLEKFEKTRNPIPFFNKLNPFTSVEELKEFSKKINNGEGCILHFDNIHKLNHGEHMGEYIKCEFIKEFFRSYFPKIKFIDEISNIDTKTSILPKNTITTTVLDFEEFDNAGRTFGINNFYPSITETDLSKISAYSMQQMKPLDITIPSENSKKEFRGKIENALNFHGTIIISPISDKEKSTDNFEACLKEFPNSKIILIPYDIYTNSLNSVLANEIKNKNLTDKIAIMNLPFGTLKYMYGVGDYALVGNNKNKLEPIACEVPVITTSNFQDKSKNPNYILDKVLYEKGYIHTIDNLENIPRKISVSSEAIIDIATLVEEDEKSKGIKLLKEETSRILKKMEDIVLK